jgi:tetrahydromethanopterin S-methyltransferase subunit F
MDGPTTPKEITGIIAGAITSLVIVGWILFLAFGYVSAG